MMMTDTNLIDTFALADAALPHLKTVDRYRALRDVLPSVAPGDSLHEALVRHAKAGA